MCMETIIMTGNNNDDGKEQQPIHLLLNLCSTFTEVGEESLKKKPRLFFLILRMKVKDKRCFLGIETMERVWNLPPHTHRL